MAEQNLQYSFLYGFVEKVLADNGYNNLDEETKTQYLPQFVSYAEAKMGAAIIPLLTKDSAQKMVDLINSDTATPEVWQKFWQENVPNFAEVIKDVMENYAKEIKEILEKVKKA